MKLKLILIILGLGLLSSMSCTPCFAQGRASGHVAGFRRTSYNSKVIRFDYVDTLICTNDKTIIIINKRKKRYVYPANQSLEIGSINVYIQN